MSTAVIANSMRLAFERATANTPRTSRTRVYAMVRSALNRKLGLVLHRTMWSVARRGSR